MSDPTQFDPQDEPQAGDPEAAEFSGEDLELAYQRALESVQTWDLAVAEEDDTAIEDESQPIEQQSVPEPSAVETIETVETVETVETAPEESSQPVATEAVAELESSVEEFSLQEPETATIPMSATPQAERRAEVESEESRVTPTQVLEAVLFVGGPPLTARKLAGLLRGSNDVTAVERTIDDLNQEYAAQNRPYEIRLGDGGYRLDLRPDFERLRLRVFGGGPREVRLSQELLEVLALVAYKQPISVAEIEELGRKGPEGHLRQLLRRELIALRRSETNPKEVRYHTTSRFLSLFGLGSLDELPQPEDVDLK